MTAISERRVVKAIGDKSLRLVRDGAAVIGARLQCQPGDQIALVVSASVALPIALLQV
jgi:hypothetical protein